MSKPSPQGLPPLKKITANTPAPLGILDELQAEVPAEAAPLLRFIARNASVVMALLGLIVVVIVGIGVWQWYASERDETAQTNFARILLQPQGSPRVDALERFAATAPDSVRLAAWMEFGLAALAEKDSDKASAAFARVAVLDKNGPFGTVAAISEAQTLMQGGKTAEALTILEQMEHTVPEHMRVQVRGLIALNAQLAGKTEQAVKAYEDLLAGSFGEDADYYRFCIQRISTTALN